MEITLNLTVEQLTELLTKPLLDRIAFLEQRVAALETRPVGTWAPIIYPETRQPLIHRTNDPFYPWYTVPVQGRDVNASTITFADDKTIPRSSSGFGAFVDKNRPDSNS